MNIRLFDHYKPKLIVAPGISMSRQMKIKYNLGPMVDQLTNYDPVNNKTIRIIESYDYRGTPFIFTKHWTSRWGANTDEKAQIKNIDLSSRNHQFLRSPFKNICLRRHWPDHLPIPRTQT